MMAARVDDVFGRSRAQMPTSRYVEVFREAAAPGERRRYTKRFLATAEGDFRPWTARESRILAHLMGHGVRCIPGLVGFDARTEAMQTFDAGVTVEHWVTLLGVQRDARVLPHVFADCAHWWALAHHTLRALETLHLLQLVHLDVKPDNICVPVLPAAFTEDVSGSRIGMQFARLALIDFAFSRLPAEPFVSPVPIGSHAEYPYQSPRLQAALEAGRAGDLRPMEALDWRCDLYSLAAMLRLYLPDADTSALASSDGWSAERHSRAMALLAALDDAHDRQVGAVWPHQTLIDMCEAGMQEPELVTSLLQGFALAPADATVVAAAPSTSLTSVETSCRRALGSMLSAPATTSTPCAVPSHTSDAAQTATSTLSAVSAQSRTPPNTTTSRSHAAVRRPRVAAGQNVAAGPSAAVVAPSVLRNRSQIVAAQRAAIPSLGSPSKTPVAPRERRTSALATQRPVPQATRVESAHSATPRNSPSAASSSPPHARPIHEQARFANPAPGFVQLPFRARPAHAIVVTTFLVVLGIAIYPRDQPQGGPAISPRDQRQGGPVLTRDADSDVKSGPATPQPADARISNAPSLAANDREIANDVQKPLAKRGTSTLPVDVATVQRAANAARSVTQHAEPGDSAPVEREATSTQSQQAPPSVSSAQPRDTQSALADTSPPPLSQERESSTAQPPTPPPAAERSPRATAPQAPNERPSMPPARPYAGTPAMVRAPVLEDVAARTERDVARVLALAATVSPGEEEKVVQVARSMRSVAGTPHVPTESPALARRLNAEARAAWERQDIDRAFRLQQRAFRANPNDAEVTGNLAFYYLKVQPVQPALARRLALYALAARGQTFPAGRVEDWGTLAVASSLEGREADAVKAMYVMFTVSGNPERACRAAHLAVAQYGEPMKVPAHAMLTRIRARGGIPGAPSCR